jgi:hypothetical protein
MPGEIRNHIYRQLYHDLDREHSFPAVSVSIFDTHKRYLLYVQLFLVSRQVRREASAIFFGEYFPH